MPSDSDTIAAIATPSGPGGIGIIKISGPAATVIRDALFRPSPSAPEAISHRLIHGVIIDPEDGAVVDDVLLAWMAAPHTYTGEDVVEINTHGGVIVMRRTLSLVLNRGARLAEPGEFTRRGFLNGRIDLTRAEAVIDVVNAQTERAARLASRHLSGAMAQRMSEIRDAITSVYAHVSARIDFPEDLVDGAEKTDALATQLETTVKQPMRRVLSRYRKGTVMRHGARIAVIGRPNVGKSSLMNRLLDHDRVIVSAAPGTTRDAVAEVTSLNGIPVTLVDTAGLRDTDDPVEAIGIQKTREAVSSAHLVLFLSEAGKALGQEDADILDSLEGLPVIMVWNKNDLVAATEASTDGAAAGTLASVTLSAKTGDGCDGLTHMITDLLTQGHDHDEDDAVMPNSRQTRHLSAAIEAIDRAIDIIGRQGEDELAAIELDLALRQVNMVLGIALPADILDDVFEQFCIGK